MNWQSLADRLARLLGFEPGPARASALQGGDINRAFRLQVGDRRFFVKTNRAGLLAMFEAEKSGLDAIRASRAIRAPEPWLVGRDASTAYIAMEFVELAGRPHPVKLAHALAALHGVRNSAFGFDCDNTIGSTAQPNGYDDDWIEFWRRRRLGFQLELARANRLDAGMIDAGERLMDRLGAFFETYRPLASLLHGDLWGGNQGADAAGDPVIYDPACYYGDHEADLAMMELFGSPGERFFGAYRERFAIDAGYAQRRDLYNLYHILNHANLFGGGYPAQAQRVIERLLAQA